MCQKEDRPWKDPKTSTPLRMCLRWDGTKASSLSCTKARSSHQHWSTGHYPSQPQHSHLHMPCTAAPKGRNFKHELQFAWKSEQYKQHQVLLTYWFPKSIMCLNLRWEELITDFCAASVSTGWQSQFCCHPAPAIPISGNRGTNQMRAVQVHKKSHTLDYFSIRASPQHQAEHADIVPKSYTSQDIRLRKLVQLIAKHRKTLFDTIQFWHTVLFCLLIEVKSQQQAFLYLSEG